MGRGPNGIHAHLMGDLILVRLKGVLTAAEQHLVKSLSGEKGQSPARTGAHSTDPTMRPVMEEMVHEVTGVGAVSLHHDISTTTGEEVGAVQIGGRTWLP